MPSRYLGGGGPLSASFHLISSLVRLERIERGVLGPTLFARLLGWQVPDGYRVTGIWMGFGLTVLLSLLPNVPGDILERLLPFMAHSLLLTWFRRR